MCEWNGEENDFSKAQLPCPGVWDDCFYINRAGYCGGVCLKRHEKTVVISADEFDRINRLLSIESLESMTESELLAVGANTHHCEGVLYVEFDDGSSLTYDLCSGTSNYFDDVVWTSADKSHDVVLDCEYELGDIEFEYEGAVYFVHVVRGG